MLRLGVVSAALLVLVGAGSALAIRVHLVVSPARVAAGGAVRVSAAASPCRVGDQGTLISAGFPGRAFGGQGAVSGRVAGHGSFTVPTRIRSDLRPGRYGVTVRCGGGNLGVSAFFRVVQKRLSFAVYLVRGEHVAPVRRFVAPTQAVAQAALAALIRGPTGSERSQGYTSAVPALTRLRGVSLSRRVLTVDLSGRFQKGGGSLSMLLRVAQIVHTATQFPTVSRVAFRLDGTPVKAIGGEGVIVSPPVGRADFDGQAPAILVEQPLPGDQVTLPLVVRGSANVFEAQFLVDVQTAGGKLLAQRSVQASAGTGSRGRFSVRIPMTTSEKLLAVVAYDRSPKDGSRIDLVRVPVTLSAGTALAPTLELTKATVDPRAHTVDARLRICFSTGPLAMIRVTERRILHGRIVATHRWAPQGVKPTRIYPFSCRANWRLNWLLAPDLRGDGTYTATIRVRDAYGRWTPPVVISDTSP